jgi:hypothetical protein
MIQGCRRFFMKIDVGDIVEIEDSIKLSWPERILRRVTVRGKHYVRATRPTASASSVGF